MPFYGFVHLAQHKNSHPFTGVWLIRARGGSIKVRGKVKQQLQIIRFTFTSENYPRSELKTYEIDISLARMNHCGNQDISPLKKNNKASICIELN